MGNLDENIKVGDIVEGKVVVVADYGVLLNCKLVWRHCYMFLRCLGLLI